MKQSRKRTKRTFAVIAAVLVVVMSLVMLVRQSMVQENTDENLLATLYQNEWSGIGTPVQIYSMHPGDEQTDTYKVQVAYHDKITLHFHLNYENRFQEAAGIFSIRVKLLTTGEILYDGSILAMPENLDYEMTADEATRSKVGVAEYKITTYLDPSVEDIYQHRKLNGYYTWWADEYSNLEPEPKTDKTQNILWLSTAILATIIATTLIARNQKDRLGREYQTL